MQLMHLALFLLLTALGFPRSSNGGHEGGPQQLTAGDKAALLQKCYNKHYNGTPSVFEDFLRGFNTSLFLHKVYWSTKRTQLPLTIFVGATLERLPALEAQCRSYPGPLAAALYVPLLQQQDGPQLTAENRASLQRAADMVQELFDRMESSSSSSSSSAPASQPACALTALLLVEAVSDPPLSRLLPVNSLRNAALLAASTPLAAMVDVDLAPSAGLAGLLAERDSLSEIMRGCEARSVWILPAWETHSRLGTEEGMAVADEAIRGDKAALVRLAGQSRLHPFAHFAYRRGHAATNFSRWLHSDVPYEVQYEVNYEPWFVISRRLVPPYDVRFRGYGWNKVAQVAHVAASNFSFVVHPGAWLVHRPHERSAGQRLYGGSGGGGGQGARAREADEVRVWKGASAPLSRLFHRRVSALRHVAVRDMRRGTYAAAVDPQSEACRAQLPWWAQ